MEGGKDEREKTDRRKKGIDREKDRIIREGWEEKDEGRKEDKTGKTGENGKEQLQ